MSFTTPDGAPAFDGTEFTIDESVGTYPLSRWVHTDCRVFVKQSKRAKLTMRRYTPGDVLVNVDERFILSGLDDAELTIFPEKGGTAWIGGEWDMWRGPKYETEYDEKRGCYVAKHVSGTVSVALQKKENFGDYRKLEFLRTPDILPD